MDNMTVWKMLASCSVGALTTAFFLFCALYNKIVTRMEVQQMIDREVHSIVKDMDAVFQKLDAQASDIGVIRTRVEVILDRITKYNSEVIRK